MPQVGEPATTPRDDGGGDWGTCAGASYAAATARYRAAFERRDFREALRTLDEAVGRHPGFAELYDRRGVVWRLLGDYVRASRDAAACRALDPHYHRRDAMRREVCELRNAFATDQVVDPRWIPGAYDSSVLRGILESRAAEARRRAALLARPSCDLPCPSQCCFFEDAPVTYGVHFAADELAAVRTQLRSAGLEEADCIGRIGSDQCPAGLRDRPGVFVRGEDGREYVYYPRCGSETAGAAGGRRPKTLDGGVIGWLTSRSRRCVFVRETGCAIHDVGDPPGLAVCRVFLCLTAFVFLVARNVGLARDGELSACAMADLDEAALAILPTMAAGLRSPEMVRAQADMRSALGAAVEADEAHDAAAMRAALARFDAAGASSEDLNARVRQDVRAVLHVNIRKEKR